MDLVLQIQKTNVGIRISILETPCVQSKRKTLNFSAQICPKMDLGLETEKSNVGIRISIVEISCVPVFRLNRQLWHFWHKFAQNWILELEFLKFKSRFGICFSKIPCMPIFSQNGQLWIFRPKFGKIVQFHATFWL